MEAWPHQLKAVDDVLRAIASGEKRILLTSPTGGGKTKIMCNLIEHCVHGNQRVALYTNRRLLVEQTSRVMSAAGIDHGRRAAGYDDDDFFPVQVCSIQTEEARVYKARKWQLHDAKIVLVDEAHCQTGDVCRKILDEHVKAGAAVVGVTATPIGLGSMYDCLITAGNPTALRACGALVPAVHYGPDEPDLKAIRTSLGEDLSEKQCVTAMMRFGVFGRVLESFNTLNPGKRPTLLFAPGVAESLWFATQFEKEGITAAHIDGESIYYQGKLEASTRARREEIFEASQDGKLTVICNRFVLREGVDMPWLRHGILATVFGSLQTYLQAGGRLLRAFPGKESVTIQDHGGNWWRHGSLNEDRVWNLEYSAGMLAGMREDAYREKREIEPYRCPKCAKIVRGLKCACGWSAKKFIRARPVVQCDGQLKELHGEVFRARRISTKPNGAVLWERMYYRSKTDKGRRTFRVAAALFAQENNWGWPDPAWPFMPIHSLDWYRLVEDVPPSRLVPKPERVHS